MMNLFVSTGNVKPASQVLNNTAVELRKRDFHSLISSEGFTINPVSRNWEWEIDFNNNSRIVLAEEKGDIRIWVYKNLNDHSETLYSEIKKIRFSNKPSMFIISQIKALYEKLLTIESKSIKVEDDGDILHPDGSKSYLIQHSGEYIKIERPEVVELIENILSKEYTGWGYMPELDKLHEDGKLTKSEYLKIIKILD